MRVSLIAGLAAAGALVALAVGCPPGSGVQQDKIVLARDGARLETTPRFGGRASAFYLEGRQSVLKFDDRLAAGPEPEITPDTDDIGYLGHSLWIGPQSQWWNQQDLRPERAGAVWPPDPYLTLAEARIVEKSASRVVYETPASPISGVVLRQTYALGDGGVDLIAEAENVRAEPVSWDLWFNTRVAPRARVYAPAASMEDIRIAAAGEPSLDAPVVSLRDGLLALELAPAGPAFAGREGKVFIQPSAGWMAALHDGQAFIIEFDLVPADAIHPEQGQLEFYIRDLRDDEAASFIEMELHAPYLTLEPGETMRARERWRLLAYDGPDERAAHAAFLARQLHSAPDPGTP